MSKDNNFLIAVHEHLKKEFEGLDYSNIRAFLGGDVSRIDFVRNDLEVIMCVHFRSSNVLMKALHGIYEEFAYCDPDFLDNICEFVRANIDAEY